jgi:hypothetical protein
MCMAHPCLYYSRTFWNVEYLISIPERVHPSTGYPIFGQLNKSRITRAVPLAITALHFPAKFTYFLRRNGAFVESECHITGWPRV